MDDTFSSSNVAQQQHAGILVVPHCTHIEAYCNIDSEMGMQESSAFHRATLPVASRFVAAAVGPEGRRQRLIQDLLVCDLTLSIISQFERRDHLHSYSTLLLSESC